MICRALLFVFFPTVSPWRSCFIFGASLSLSLSSSSSFSRPRKNWTPPNATRGFYVRDCEVGTSEQAASFISSTLRASLHIPFFHISEVIRTAQTPGGVDDVDPRVVVPGRGRFATNENNRVCTVRLSVGDLCFCLFASLRVPRVVLNICIRRALDGVDVNSGNNISKSLC
jgi:hypothetical protein